MVWVSRSLFFVFPPLFVINFKQLSLFGGSLGLRLTPRVSLHCTLGLVQELLYHPFRVFAVVNSSLLSLEDYQKKIYAYES